MVRRIVGKASLTTLLGTLGFLMHRSSKRNPWFRNQVTKDLVIEIKSRDGLAHHYQFVRATREVTSKSGPAPQATVSVLFDNALQGFGVLSHPHAVSKLIDGALDETIKVDGNAALLLWFFGLTRIVVPMNRQRPLAEPLPGALMSPNPNSAVYEQVTREPVADELDTTWVDAAAARATLINLRAPAGEAVPMW